MNSHESKNQRRKTRRARYYEMINALTCNRQDGKAIDAAKWLFSQYCHAVDRRIEAIGSSTLGWHQYLQRLLDKHAGTASYSVADVGKLPKVQEALCQLDEAEFVDELLEQLNNNGWVTIDTPEGSVQIKADMGLYIEAKRASERQQSSILANVAQDLRERALRRVRPRHV